LLFMTEFGNRSGHKTNAAKFFRSNDWRDALELNRMLAASIICLDAT
jgi:hypothetical protein